MPEALWLAEEVEDVLVGYPTANRAALRTLTDDPRLAARVAVMVDSPEHLAFVAEATGGAPVRVCLDLDASLHLLGDRVWFRHPKAGEVCEHVNERRLVRGGEVVDVVPTYRGEGRAFL